MLELGDQAETLHQELGATAIKSNISRLYITGQFSSSVADGAFKGGMPAERIVTGSKVEIISALAHELQPQDWVLVKGSRGMKMEQISEAVKTLEITTND